jgi:flagellar basal body-associated protein FliL
LKLVEILLELGRSTIENRLKHHKKMFRSTLRTALSKQDKNTIENRLHGEAIGINAIKK